MRVHYAIFLLATHVCASAVAAEQWPQPVDSRLTFELFAEHPLIVTPTGIAVDAKGRVLVIESHTHFRPDGYQGPPADRIQMLEDTDDDGRADRISTFFEGTTHTMNLAVYRDSSVYVATRNEVFRLHDTNNDGKADQRTTIARLDTPGNYPHNGLSGFAFDSQDNVYFGLGENLGAPYKLIGSDGRTLSGGGEGGSVYRCRADGSGLERTATGFWNPFHLCLDRYERLFVVDNDPDWRPPCRLLHIVPGGDYGYQYRLGRRGTHPFTSWFGELPGTLGMVAGTGEAPSGIVACGPDMLPDDYRGNLLVTSWGVHAIERYRLQPQGATFRSTAETIVKGDGDFRPVGIAPAPDGSFFISDWVDRSYRLHGKGRIWRLAAQGPVQRSVEMSAVQRMRVELSSRSAGKALSELLSPSESPDVRELAVRIAPSDLLDLAEIAGADASPPVRAAALRRLDAAKHRDTLFAALGDDDAFIRQAARYAVQQTQAADDIVGLKLPDDPAQRVETALLLRGTHDPRAVQRLPELLNDENEDVRFVALRWIGEDELQQFQPQLDRVLEHGNLTGRLFEAYFACRSLLAGNVEPTKFEAEQIMLVAQWLGKHRDASPRVLQLALRKIAGQPGGPLSADQRRRLIEHVSEYIDYPDDTVRVDAVRTLRELGGDFELQGTFQGALLDLVNTQELPQPPAVSAEAVAWTTPVETNSFLQLARHEERIIRHAVLRSLRGARLRETEKATLTGLRERFPDSADLVDRLIQKDWKPKHRPPQGDIEQWVNLTSGGDAADGERLFFHPRGPRCYACHQVDGRGGFVGPDLSSAGRLGARRLIESIVAPSSEMAPQFVPWVIRKTDGKVVTGVLVSERGEEEIYADAEGRLFAVPHSDIEARKPLGKSIMPDGLADTMTDRELRDLMAFLLQQTGT